MFRPNTPLYLRDVTFGTEKIDDTTKKIVTCVFMVQPFTRELAATVEMQNRLFGVSDGEPLPDVLRAELAGPAGLMQMQFRMAPDQSRTSLVVRNVKIGTFKVRKDKEGPVYAAEFKASFFYPDPKELMFLANGVNEQHFVTFEAEQGDMLTDGKGAPRAAEPVGAGTIQ
jgi:hypothetical protein